MKKNIAAVFLGLLLLSSCKSGITPKSPGAAKTSGVIEPPAVSVPSPESRLKVSDYFPLTKDVHIKYKGMGNEYAEFETYVEYVKDNIIQVKNINPGTSVATVYTIEDGMLKKIYSRPETYYRYDFTSFKGGEEVLIKEPIAVGTEWTLKDEAKRSITSVDKEISTSLGTYKALEVTTKWPESVVREYYVRDIGLVKRTFNYKDSTETIASEIEKIESGVPFKHTVIFFFPDIVNDRNYYMERTVEINTNQDMKYKFQKELKTVPEGSGLIKPLTPGVQVLSSVVDYENGILTADFSSHLTSEMSAGAGPESEILKSIVNTFGRYYQVDKVIITVEGKPYSSGHILMKPGEYFKVDTDNILPYN